MRQGRVQDNMIFKLQKIRHLFAKSKFWIPQNLQTITFIWRENMHSYLSVDLNWSLALEDCLLLWADNIQVQI